MELLFVTLGGAMIAALLRYLIPGRHAYGSVLLPAIGVVVAAIVWAALTWVGWTFDGTWIWVVSLFAAGAVSLATALLLPRRRREADARLLARLSKP